MLQKIKWMMSAYSEHKVRLLLLIILTPIHAAVFMMDPLVLKYIFDSISDQNPTLPRYLQFLENWARTLGLSQIGGAVAILILFAATTLVIYISLQGTRAWMNMRLEWIFRQRAFDATTELGPDFFNKFRTGDLVTRMTDDVAEKLSWFACSGIFRFYEAVLLVAFGLFNMLTLDSKLTLYTMAPLPILIVVYIFTSSKLDNRFDWLQSRISLVNNTMEAAFSGMRVIKAYSREQMWRRKFERIINDRRSAEIKAVRAWSAIEMLYTHIWQFGFFLVVMFGGAMAVTGTITIGDFVAFMVYLRIMVYPMFDIGAFLVKGRQSAVSIDRLQAIDSFPPMVVNRDFNTVEIDFSQISFADVSFHYGNENRTAVRDVTFEVNRGETVALVGRVGSGKSTIVSLLTRTIDPTAGAVRLDGREITTLPLESYRDIIGYVPQEPILFSETLENNIRFGNGDASNESLTELIELAQLREQLERFPKGLQTLIGTRGLNISGGEKQRVAIARALARQPKILILDDCTSALDARTEEDLWAALDEVMPDMTCFVVTHRTREMQKADQILLFDEGIIADRGTHEELLMRSELYRELYERSELEEQVKG